ncbi:DinB family protein [Emticicia sp. SJ17W-69]|uniref:DinB family protein n=1 Tax=Emticicia sp. SJ17W-69 TaxID=3421657 RepID=UPI003EC14D2B
MKISRPSENEYNTNSPQYRYIQAVTGEDAFKILRENFLIVENFFKNLPIEKLHFRYAEGKWTPIEVLGHIIDTERILAYRALCIARGEKQSLPGFEEEDYVKATNFEKQSLRNLLLHYKAVRKANLLLFKTLSTKEWKRIGKANNINYSARALAWLIAGHEIHHLNILKERYL